MKPPAAIVSLPRLPPPYLPPSRLQGVPWSRNSCHLDSLLEALHQALYPINFAALIAAEIADCSSPSEAWAWLLSKRAAGRLTAAIREQWWSVYVEKYFFRPDKAHLGATIAPAEWLSPLEECSHEISHPICVTEFLSIAHNPANCSKQHHRRASIVIQEPGDLGDNIGLLQHAIANLGSLSCSCQALCDAAAVRLPPVMDC